MCLVAELKTFHDADSSVFVSILTPSSSFPFPFHLVFFSLSFLFSFPFLLSFLFPFFSSFFLLTFPLTCPLVYILMQSIFSFASPARWARHHPMRRE